MMYKMKMDVHAIIIPEDLHNRDGSQQRSITENVLVSPQNNISYNICTLITSIQCFFTF